MQYSRKPLRLEIEIYRYTDTFELETERSDIEIYEYRQKYEDTANLTFVIDTGR